MQKYKNSLISKSALNQIGILLRGFMGLLYPGLCCTCRAVLLYGEKYLCTHCRVSLPKTGFELYRDNRLSQLFWGRMYIETGAALFYFEKGDRVQDLIHRFKYRGDKELGLYLAYCLGQHLRSSPLYDGIDLVLPVPLHPLRMRKRGFNQSAIIADGIARALELPSPSGLLVRKQETSTQTRKSRYKRWENVSRAFSTPHPALLENKRVLLVDDVITTGSTLEACGQQLLSIKGLRLWIACLAMTS